MSVATAEYRSMSSSVRATSTSEYTSMIPVAMAAEYPSAYSASGRSSVNRDENEIDGLSYNLKDYNEEYQEGRHRLRVDTGQSHWVNVDSSLFFVQPAQIPKKETGKAEVKK